MLLLTLAAATACSRSDLPLGCRSLGWEEHAPAASVVLIVADTLRRDAPGLYGGRARTPAFDALGRRGIVFERAFAQAPWTKPSVATLFTGLHPSQHGVSTQRPDEPDGRARHPSAPPLRQSDVLSDGFATLAEAYRAAGFRTAAFVSNPWLEDGYGFGQGFEVYDDSFARWEAPGALVSLAAIRWLEGLGDGERFFLYLHYLDPHQPYGPLDRAHTLAHADELERDTRPLPEEARRLLVEGTRFSDGGSALEAGLPPTRALLEHAYAAGVEQFDRALAGFVEALEALHDLDEIAWIVTSDHGESLYAHGFGNHGTSLYQDEVAIPLLMLLPGVEHRGVRSDCPVGLVDLKPLLCAYSRLDCAGDGVDPLRAEGPPLPPYVVSEGVRGAPRHRALVGARYKLIWEPDHPDLRGRSPYRLFDLETDPEEHEELGPPAKLEGPPATAFEAMRAALGEAVAPYDAPLPERRAMDPLLERRLEALGYID